MRCYVNIDGLLVKCWSNNPEPRAIEQANNLAVLPFAFHHIAIMADIHEGIGMPIGGILATQGYVVPNAVGVDIGCGMLAAKSNLKEISRESLLEIKKLIEERVPVGFSHQATEKFAAYMPKSVVGPIVEREFESAIYQLGTLGGGNHFIEIQQGDDGFVWVMIHSGSRNLGKQVAEHYDAVAKELNSKYFSSVKKEVDLAFLSADSEEGKDYLTEARFCQDFATANRLLIFSEVASAFYNTLGKEALFTSVERAHHNYVNMENHFGKNVYVHRKGAIAAYQDQIGIIPGDQGRCSYIVKGLGNPESFFSCSHGAGRKMGRKQAKRELDLKEEISKMDAQGIIHNIKETDDLDEASGAYKDIEVVMKEQLDLITPIVKLKPLAVIKG